MIILDILTVLEPKQPWTFTGADYSTKEEFKENFSLAEADWSFTWAEFQAKQTEVEGAVHMKLLRNKRDKLLTKCDWTQGADVPDTIKNAWVSYRQSLRDITNGVTTVEQANNVTWPTKP